MPIVNDWTIPGADDQPILGNTHLPEGGPVGTLIVCHGFKGYKDYGFMPYLAQRLAEAGFVAHRFNFSHSGMTHRVQTFERPDLFERDTYSRQIFDVQRVATAAARGELPGPERSANGDALPAVWFGHSRGGMIALLTAARCFAPHAYPPSAVTAPPPGGVIAAATPHEAARWDQHSLRAIREQGYLESPSSRTGQVLRIGKNWLDEIEHNPQAFDPVRAIGLVTCPVLIVHGDKDPTVPLESAHAYKQAAGANGQLEIIPGGTHVFNAPNPMRETAAPPPPLLRLIELVLDFASRAIAR